MIPFQGHSFIESGTARILLTLAEDAGATLPMGEGLGERITTVGNLRKEPHP